MWLRKFFHNENFPIYSNSFTVVLRKSAHGAPYKSAEDLKKGGHSFECFCIWPWKSTHVMFTATWCTHNYTDLHCNSKYWILHELHLYIRTHTHTHTHTHREALYWRLHSTSRDHCTYSGGRSPRAVADIDILCLHHCLLLSTKERVTKPVWTSWRLLIWRYHVWLCVSFCVFTDT